MNEPWPVGTRVEKVNSEKGDSQPNGALGTIVEHPQMMRHFMGPLDKDLVVPNGNVVKAGTLAYFVQWDNFPYVPVGVMGPKLRPVRVN